MTVCLYVHRGNIDYSIHRHGEKMSKNLPLFEFIDWEQVYEYSFRLARNLCQSGFKAEVIIGISRGGWIPARILSDLLNNSNLASMKVEFYCGIQKTKEVPKITQCLNSDVRGKAVLIVDEIVDSGRSLKIAKDHVLVCGASKVRTVLPLTSAVRHWVIFGASSVSLIPQ